jgi:putative peptidoglycan lipid II flippase
MIAGLVWLVPSFGVEGLVAGVLAGGVLQCLVQVPAFVRRGLGWLAAPALHPGVARILRLMLPRLLGTGVYHVSVFVDTILASFYWIVGAGGQSALYYASRLFQLPLALFGVSFAQAALPSLAVHAARNETAEFRDAALFAVRQTAFLTLPAAAGLAVYADLIVRVLFQRGEFTESSAAVTAGALFFYAWGLAGAALVKIFANAFYALQDTRTPVKTAGASLLVNLALNLALMWHLRIGGLALATSLSATLNAVLLFRALERRVGAFDRRRLGRAFGKAAAAAAGLAGFCAATRPWVAAGLEAGTAAGALRLGAGILGALAVYAALSGLLRSAEGRECAELFAARRRAAGAA